MARKFCPVCNRLVGGSAIDCECGHVFDPSTVVAVLPPKLCPHCGVGNPQAATICHCGQHFDLNVDQSRALLKQRFIYGAAMAGFGVAGFAATLCIFLVYQVISVWPFIGAALLFSNGLRVIFTAKHVLSSLPPSLPKATLKGPRV